MNTDKNHIVQHIMAKSKEIINITIFSAVLSWIYLKPIVLRKKEVVLSTQKNGTLHYKGLEDKTGLYKDTAEYKWQGERQFIVHFKIILSGTFSSGSLKG